MNKEKKEKRLEDSDQPDPARRSFLTKSLLGLGILALANFIGVALAFLSSRKPIKRTGDIGQLVTAGSVEDFAKDSVTAFVRGRFYLVRREEGGFLAVSRTCTHLGCAIHWNDEEHRFLCPCHSSAFAITGDVLNPPATSTLDVFPIVIENGIVIVDTAKPTKRKRLDSLQLKHAKL